MGTFNTTGQARGVAAFANRVYVADSAAGLLVLPMLSNVLFTARVEPAGRKVRTF